MRRPSASAARSALLAFIAVGALWMAVKAVQVQARYATRTFDCGPVRLDAPENWHDGADDALRPSGCWLLGVDGSFGPMGFALTPHSGTVAQVAEGLHKADSSARPMRTVRLGGREARVWETVFHYGPELGTDERVVVLSGPEGQVLVAETNPSGFLGDRRQLVLLDRMAASIKSKAVR